MFIFLYFGSRTIVFGFAHGVGLDLVRRRPRRCCKLPRVSSMEVGPAPVLSVSTDLLANGVSGSMVLAFLYQLLRQSVFAPIGL